MARRPGEGTDDTASGTRDVRVACRATVASLVLAVALALPRGAEAKDPAAGPAGWWNRAWPLRRALTLSPSGPLAPKTAAVSFTTPGGTAADGSDVRVIGPDGRPVGAEVVSVGPGDAVTLLFEASDPQGRYAVYWGNPAPSDRPPAWSRDGGLVCEVRRWDSPFPVDSPQAVELALATARDVEGRVLRRKIFDGQNPCGSSRTYVAVYRGFFRVQDEADYELCSVSSDASLLRVADREVPLWSRFRGPQTAQRGRFSTKVHLAAGNHPIEYLHFVAGGQPEAAEVGLRKAGTQAWRVLWDPDYVQPVPAQAGPPERVTGPPPADFSWTTVQHLETEGRYLLRTSLEAPAGAYARCEWDFGDGRRGEGEKVEHVYVGRGVRTVRLRATDAKGAVETATLRVGAEPAWGQVPDLVPGSEARWAEDLRRAAATALSVEEIDPALAAARVLAADDVVRAAAEDAFAMADALRGDLRVGVFLGLAEFFDAARTRDEDRASRALSLALATPAATPRAAARAALASAEHAMAMAGDAAGALALLDRAPSAALDEADERRATLVRADALASAGRLEEASRLVEAVPDRASKDPRTADAARRARLHATQAWLATGDAAAAADGARGLLDDFPRERLRAEVLVVLADAWLRLGEARGAAAALERALRLEPDGPQAPRALLLLARARERLGDAAAAAKARARLTTEFPYADEAAEAARPPSPAR